MERPDYTFSSKNTRGYRLTIVTQLLQAIETMHRPEEMFQWLASAIVQCFDVSIIQFWTRESGWSGQPHLAQLRALDSQDRSLPAYMISEKMTMTVEHISKEQRIFPPQPVEQLFPHFQASLLKRYGLNYCAYCLIDKALISPTAAAGRANQTNVSFAPAGYALSHERTLVGLTFIALLLLRRYPQQDLIPTISIILEQALGIAEKHRLLLPVAANSGRLSLPDRLSPSKEYPAINRGPTVASRFIEDPPQEALSALPGLIPRIKQDGRLLVSSNPFASSVTISDKQALRLYTAIDGRKTVDELRSIGMTLQEVQTALQTLLKLDCIEIYTPEGQPVDATLLFK